MTGQSTRDPAADRDRVRISVQDRSSAPVAPRRRQFRSQRDRHRDTVAAARGRLP
jgi:hypothetical protein